MYNIKMCFTRCLLFICIFQHGIAKDTLPVFLIDHDQVLEQLVEPNPFTRTGSAMFSDIVDDAMKQSSILVIFVEEQFCTEDVSGKDESGTPYHNLHEDIIKYKVKYIPNVVSPLNTVSRILEPTQMNVFVLEPGQIFQPTEDLKYFYIFFQDNEGEETRIEALRRHDTAMHEIYGTIRKITNGAVVGIYTGKVNPIMLTSYRSGIIGAERSSSDNSVFLAANSSLLNFIGLSLKEASPTSNVTPPNPVFLDDMVSKKGNMEYLEFNVQYHTVQLRYYFKFTWDYWFLDNITLFDAAEKVGSVKFDIKVPIGMSYYCDEPKKIVSSVDGTTVMMSEYQIQPFASFQSENGLVMAAIFFIPFLIGLRFLFRVRSINRFEDPCCMPIMLSADG
ncbi:uncharacterized protein LOC128674965 isoform X2 [Plodia interpunctella]|uniref:uncharacterized protein LOC128674965 isoform X2 n=1 Tax=Plodia interpunctella TaxID=58824 RepID=UPI0023684E9E|nr:uncharacterized protein LOC128674965 isoform X2 [Plodia interpunctella]